MFGLGIPELIIILVVALLVFGPRKLPEIGKSIGSSIKEFKRSITGEKDTDANVEKKEKEENA